MTAQGCEPARAARTVLAALVVVVLLAAGASPAGAAGGREGVPVIHAPSAILVEPATGDVVFDRHGEDPRFVASTTKLMTALLTLERSSLSRQMTAVRYRAAPAESIAGFRAGERLTVADLLRALLVDSANDAAATLAHGVAGSSAAFVVLMNRRARELGLTSTHYANPIGLDEAGNHSSAADLVKLALILRRNAFFRQVTNLRQTTLRSGAHPRTFPNRNLLVRTQPFVNGVKTGHTSRAGYVLVGSATRGGITVISAVLGDPSEAARDADSLALLRYGLSRYHRITVMRKGGRYAQARLRFRHGDVALVASRTVRRIARRDETVTTRVVDAPAELDGPLPAHARVGTIEVLARGRVVGRVDLVTAAAVPEAGFLDHARAIMGATTTIALLGVLVLASLQLVLLRRRAVRRRRRAGEGIA
ncbi:MAG: D-alanyl-D-alanine carboxypeptidase [Solirubrobacterales bacterium]|nr:D-alanyl-D-alanine carboxypeptidase [Solirubrobacterales bacterium]